MTHLGQRLHILDHPGRCRLGTGGSEGLVLQVVVLLLQPPAPRRQLLHGRLLLMVMVR